MKVTGIEQLPNTLAYLNRIGAVPRSMRRAAVGEQDGKYWKQTHSVEFALDGTVTVRPKREDLLPDDTETLAIQVEFATAQWPKVKPLFSLVNVPDMIANAPKSHRFEFKRREDNAILMVQVRIDKDDGTKIYVIWTYWDDDVWRMQEPDGKLPLFNAEKIKDVSTAVIHEGCKAARLCQRLIEQVLDEDRKALAAHPWGEQLVGAVHLGWVGGAPNPNGTDWQSAVDGGITHAYIVSDNDRVGEEAVSQIAKALGIKCTNIRFDSRFPPGFDLADDFPDNLFDTFEGERFYIGPTFRDCLAPATYATRLIPNGTPKPGVALAKVFKGQWVYVPGVKMFINVEFPYIRYDKDDFNRMLFRFSDVPKLAEWVFKDQAKQTMSLAYRPDKPGQFVITEGDGMTINLYTPSNVIAKSGYISMLRTYLEHLIPIPEERHELERWIATLIGRPDVRMHYGILLRSQMQGTGKTVLAEHVLAPLVGMRNFSSPSTASLESTTAFNEWAINKRLVLIQEIYAGKSWRVYNNVKTYLTDKFLAAHQKFIKEYQIDNWLHFYACSNDPIPLRISQDDRRWFIPEVTEIQMDRVWVRRFIHWLRCGGLAAIKHWAEHYPVDQYVIPGKDAPDTAAKRRMANLSRSKALITAEEEAGRLAYWGATVDIDTITAEELSKTNGEATPGFPVPTAIPLHRIMQSLTKQIAPNIIHDLDTTIRDEMIKHSEVFQFEKRIYLDGSARYILINGAMKRHLDAHAPLSKEGDAKIERMRLAIVRAAITGDDAGAAGGRPSSGQPRPAWEASLRGVNDQDIWTKTTFAVKIVKKYDLRM